MKTYKTFLREKIECDPQETKVTEQELVILEKYLDRIFAALKIDIKFSGHFRERLNDSRNKKQISICELQEIYHSLMEKHGASLRKGKPEEVEKVVKSISTGINIPVAIEYNRKTKMVEIRGITVMRKKGFKAKGKELTVESTEMKLTKSLKKDLNFLIKAWESWVSLPKREYEKQFHGKMSTNETPSKLDKFQSMGLIEWEKMLAMMGRNKKQVRIFKFVDIEKAKRLVK